MYTTSPSPGKFEGNQSQALAAAAYQASLDGDIVYGDVIERGMTYVFVEGRRWTFAVAEDSQGFVIVVPFDRHDQDDAQRLYNTRLNVESWDADV